MSKKAVQTIQVDVPDVGLALEALAKLNSLPLSEFSSKNRMRNKDLRIFCDKVKYFESSLKEFKDIMCTSESRSVASLTSFIIEEKFTEFWHNIVALGSYMEDKERNNLSKHLQSLKNDLQLFLKLKDKKFAIKAYEGVQCINAEMEKILSLWKNMFSELEQSKSLTETAISDMQTLGVSLLNLNLDSRTEPTYLLCVKDFTCKLLSLSNNVRKLGSLYPFGVSKSLCKLAKDLQYISTLVEKAMAYHRWNLAFMSEENILLATLIDCCTNIYQLHQKGANDSFNSNLMRFLSKLESLKDFLPADCTAIVLKMQQEKTDIVKSVMLIKSILMDMNNMKAHLNDDKPTFYNKYIDVLQSFLTLQNLCKVSWEKSGSINFDKNHLSDFVRTCRASVFELRSNYFEAKMRFYSLFISKPAPKDLNIVVLGEQCSRELHSILTSLPEVEIHLWSEEAMTKINCSFDACSDVADHLLSLCRVKHDTSLYKNLCSFIDKLKIFYSVPQNNSDVEESIHLLLKNITCILKEELSLQSQKKLQRHIHDDGNNFFEVVLHVLFNHLSWNFSEDFTISLKSHVVDGSAELIMHSDFTAAWDSQNCLVMSSKIAFYKEHFGKNFYYKYVILSPDANSEELLYIHQATMDDCKSCFRVVSLPYEKELGQGTYCIYDSFVYPQRSKGIFERLSSLQIFTPTFKDPDRINEGELCVETYLAEDFSRNFECRPDEDVIAFYRKLKRVYDSLKSIKKCDIRDMHQHNMILKISGKSFEQVIVEKACQALKNPQASYISLYIILSRFLIHVKPKQMSAELTFTILSALQVSYDDVSRKCLQYEVIQEHSNSLSLQKLLVDVCLHFLKSYTFMEWHLLLKFLPLYHWFVQDCAMKPFTKLDTKPLKLMESFQNSEKLLGSSFQKLKSVGNFPIILDQIKPVELDGDSMLQTILFLACPAAEYSFLLKHISLSVLLVGIGREIINTSSLDKKSKVLIKVLSDIKSNHVHSSTDAVEAMSFLVSCLKDKIQCTSKPLIFACIKTMQKFSTSSQALSIFSGILQHLVFTYMRSHSFGGDASAEPLKEYKLWIEIMQCGENCKEWHQIVVNLTKDRVKKISTLSTLIKIFKKLYKNDEADPIVEAVINIIEERIIFFSHRPKEMENLAAHHSKFSKRIFSRCLDMKYPDPDFVLTIESVMEYDMWPLILTSYGSDGRGFSEHSHSLCAKLTGVLQHTQDCIATGDISVSLFRKIEVKWGDHLYPILKFKNHEVSNFKKALKSAVERIVLFQFHQALIKHFIKHLDRTFEVFKIADPDFDSININELCVQDGEELWHYPFFKEAAAIKPVLIPFAIMTSEQCNNDIFHQQCKDQVKKLHNNEVTWSEISDAIKRTLDYCFHILEKIKDLTITLHDINALFCNKASGGVISQEISHLDNALSYSQCTIDILHVADTFFQKAPCNVSSILVAVIKCSNQSSLFQFDEIGANIWAWNDLTPLFKEAKDFTDILNDFQVDPHDFISFSDIDLHTTELKSVVRAKKEVLNFMKKTKDLKHHVKNSVKEFAKCTELIGWITTESEDVTSMENFIGVVLDTLAEGGDAIQNRLTDLSELCSRFEPLIYQLDAMKSIPKTENILKIVVEAFEDTYDRLEHLSDTVNVVKCCNDNIAWYKRIGELQGSIEQGAVAQMREINQNGVYSIQASKEFHKCVITLQTKEVTLNINDLNELESKLVLITRQTSQWAQEKESFQEMLKRVNFISESVQKLKDFGHFKYLKMKKDDDDLKYPCFKYLHHLKGLDKKIKELGQVLIGWMFNVWNCRYRYPELNYFTTEQIIVLRKELTLMKKDFSKEVNPQVFYLLHSVIGEPVDSVMLLKKGLKCDVKHSVAIEEEEDNLLSIPTDLSHSVDAISLSDKEIPDAHGSNQEEDSILKEAIDKLNEKQTELFQELLDCGYEDYLCLEAATEYDDVYTAMNWCDELDDEKKKTFKRKWIPLETITSGVSAPEDHSLPVVLQSEPVKRVTTDIPIVDHFDVSPIVSSLVGSDVHCGQTSLIDDTEIMSLEDLGKFLRSITELREKKMVKRYFLFEKGTPNLILASPDDIFNSVLQIYAEDEDAPLPCYDEVFLCSSNTTLEQVIVFWMRALLDKDPGKIYCLVHAEKLSYLVADKAIDLLFSFSQGLNEYRLVVVCSNESKGKSHIITRLNSYHRDWNKSDDDPEKLKTYLKNHLIPKTDDRNVNASIIDEDKSFVRVVCSHQAGAGKSLYIRKMKEKLNAVLQTKEILVSKEKLKVMLSIPLHGPDVTPDEVLKMLLTEEHVTKSCIVHIDVSQRVLHSVDDILFSIIILNGLSDSRGHIWRCHFSHFYVIELTIPYEKNYIRRFTETRRVLSLLDLFPNKKCYQPIEMIANIGKSDLTDLCTPMYQRVYKYLKLLDLKDYQALEKFQYIGTLEDTDEQCLETIINHCGTPNPTWKEIRHFVWFLNHQLSACEQSNVIRTVKGLKEFTVKFMIDMSRDFATSSMPKENDEDLLKQHIPRQNWEHSLHPYLFFNKNRKSITHVGLALNGLEVVNEQSFAVSGHFHSIKKNKFSMKITPEVQRFLSRKDVPTTFQRSNTESSDLFKRLITFMNIPIEDDTDIVSPDENYVLTQDNLTKIMGIQTRFRCQIPVVLMGETGCGKTHLIRFMCKVAAYGIKDNDGEKVEVKNMFIMKIHGGTTEDDVVKCLEEADNEASNINRKLKVDTVVFFDEANTSDVISLIKEIMCDGKCRGIPVPPYLKFVAACNPYRCHSEAMINQLKRAGLGWRDNEPSRASEKLGEIPLRDLVYRVLQIPDSLKSLVYDFGKLDSSTERGYVHQIVISRLKDVAQVARDEGHAIAIIFAECQNYLKSHEDDCSFVSLRDVERAMILFQFFHDQFIDSFPIQSKNSKTTDSLLLALSVSYFARLDTKSHDGAHDDVNARAMFEDHIFQIIQKSNDLTKLPTLNKYRAIVLNYQTKLLECMSIEENIAKNTALKENLFMMFVCIQLRIPLFLVGKPGSSKSLAKTIIQTSMKGQNSKNPVLKKFNHVHLHSYQCSELSTASSIEDVFDAAENYQKKRREKNDSSFVSVVVLDEVGLAEASPYLPLKSLHPLLEDGTAGSGSTDERVTRKDRVAFIGISNWALDPAKMNRGIMVRRSDPTIKDLEDSARGICTDAQTISEEDGVLPRLKGYFPKLARAYHDVLKQQPREFFGLRDYYSLIKMLYWMTESTGTMLTVPQLRHAIRRNFSGFSATDEFNPFQIFVKNFPELDEKSQTAIESSNLMKRLHNNAVVLLKCETSEESEEFLAVMPSTNSILASTVLAIRKERDIMSQFVVHISPEKKISFQSLYLPEYYLAEQNGKLVLNKGLCLFSVKETRGHGIQLVIQMHQKPVECDNKANFFPINPDNSITNPDCSPRGLIKQSLITDLSKHGESRYLLFLTDNYSSLQVLKRYIVNSCSESHLKPVVLFGSSFPKDRDFAQVCRNISKIRLCMETGQMIILLNLENLYESLYDLLNQYYIKSGRHRYVDLGLRTHRMKCSVHEKFKLILIAEKNKVFEDFPTPLVNRLEKHFINNETILEDWQKTVVTDIEKWLKLFVNNTDGFKEEDAFIGYNSDTKSAVVLQATAQFDNEDPAKQKKVLLLSKKLLLQMATPDAIVRAFQKNIYENKFLQQVYFYEQEHSSLAELLKRIPQQHKGNVLLQVTSHSLPLYQKELQSLRELLQIDDKQLDRTHLEAFETEYDFMASVDFAIDKGKMQNFYQIFECEYGQDNGNLISCCRYRLVDKVTEKAAEESATVFVLIVHLPRKYDKSDFVSFQEQPWICYHVDDLIPSKESIALLRQACCQSVPLSQLFLADSTYFFSEQSSSGTIYDHTPFCQLLPIEESSLCQPVNLCNRIHTYITDAVSQSVNLAQIDSSQQIKQLENLIFSDIPTLKSPETLFHLITVELMQKVLKESSDCHEWVYEEAQNLEHLQEGGSFSNALLRRFDKALQPLFIHIIKFIDLHSNLQLLRPDFVKESDKPLSKLWLDIYSSSELCQNVLYKIIMSRQHATSSGRNFHCQFPFSWVIFEYINRKIIEDGNEDGTELQDFCKTLPPTCFEDLTSFYVHDFVCLLRASDVAPSYCDLLAQTLKAMSSESCKNSGDFLNILLEIHCTYRDYKDYFDCFLELAVKMPKLIKITEAITDISYLIVTTLKEILNSLHLDEKAPLKGSVALRGWMQTMYQLQAVMDKIFNNLQLEDCSDLQRQWQRLCVMKLFIEHVVVDHEAELLMFAIRLDKYSDKIEDFRGPQILKFVSTLLIAIEDGILKKTKDQNKQSSIVQSCWNFFVNVLLNFCFADNKEVLEILVDSCFSDAAQAPKDKLHTYILHHPENLPFLQSFTIKLVLSQTQDQAAGTLIKIRQTVVSSSQQRITLPSFYALVISHLKLKVKNDGKDKTSDMVYCTDELLSSNCQELAVSNGDITAPECLLAVAQIMHSCQLLAKTIADKKYRSTVDVANLEHFYTKVEVEFQESDLNDDASKSGPLYFLLRFLVRRYGMSALANIIENQSQQLSWILPSDIEEILQECNFVNYGAIYQPEYQEYYKAICEATTTSGNFKALTKICNSAFSDSNLVPLIMALQHRVQLSYVSSLPSNQLSPANLKELYKFVRDCKLFNGQPEIFKCIELIVIKNMCHISKLKLSEEDTLETVMYRMLVIDSVLTIQANMMCPLITILYTLLTSPQTLQGCMLPAMPCNIITTNQDMYLFPECVKGHKFTSVMVDISCPQCGNIIKLPEASLAKVNTQALAGYVQVATGCETPPIGYLNGISYSIIRCIMHCILLWAAHDGKDIEQLCHGRITDPKSYFWDQVKADINSLSNTISCSTEEASLIIHFVLKEINQKSPQLVLPHTITTKFNIKQLPNIADREQWEELFHRFYIAPVTKDFESCLQINFGKMHATDYSSLFDTVYMAPGKASPFLWQVYPQPSFEYFKHGLLSLQLRKTNPVLFTLLAEVHCLNATQYVSDIVKLQKKLSQIKFNVDKFDDFLQQLDEKEQEHYKNLVKSLNSAWSSCKYCLVNNYDRLDVSEATDLDEITGDTPMKFLLPTTSGFGVLSTALVDHLVTVHNSFIKQCREFVENTLNKKWMWKAHTVSLLEYESSLHAINCNIEILREAVTNHSMFIVNQSGTAGIKYMLDNLEKDVVQRLVLGKPAITETLNIPVIMNDVTLRQVIALIKKNIEQSPLPLKIKSDSRPNLRTVQIVVSNCEVLELVMKFLSKQSAPKSMKLKEYIEVDLQIKERIRSKTIMEYCNLEHIVGLWRFLQVECAKIKNRNRSKNDPFAVRKEFREIIRDSDKNRLQKAARKVSNLDYLLEMLFEFIHTYVQYCDANDSKKPLKEFFEKFLKQTRSDLIPDLGNIFPPNVLLGQVTACWKCLADLEDTINKVKHY